MKWILLSIILTAVTPAWAALTCAQYLYDSGAAKTSSKKLIADHLTEALKAYDFPVSSPDVRPFQFTLPVTPTPENLDFEFSPSAAQRLAPEDGSQKLRAIRLNWDSNSKSLGYDASKKVFFDFANALREMPGVELWVAFDRVDESEVREAIAKLSRDIRSRTHLVPHSAKNTMIWAQDASKPLENENTTLVQKRGLKVNRSVYRDVITALGEQGLAAGRKSSLAFEGGNIIVGSHHTFVGSDIIQHFEREKRITNAQAIAAYGAEFGRPVIEIGAPSTTGARVQPDFHIDLSMAVVRDLTSESKEDVVVMQSVEKFLQVAFGFPALESMTNEQFARAKVRALEESIAQVEDGRKIVGVERTLFQALRRMTLSDAKKMEERYRALERIVEAEGYRVHRIPGMTFEGGPGGHHSDFIWPLPFYNYTNIIVSDDQVLVPNYGLERLDRVSQNVYRALGYQVIKMHSAPITFGMSGGPRCAAETYRRRGARPVEVCR